jgi:hypothetical protein
MVFEYMPQAASTTDDQLVFAFANDPLHPVIGVDPAAPAALTNAALLGMSDSVPFMPWREWSLDVTEAFSNDQPFFVSRVASLGTIGADYSTLRFSEGGVLAMTNSGTSASRKTYGVLYLHSEIELVEFCPILPYNLMTVNGQKRNASVSLKGNLGPADDLSSTVKDPKVTCSNTCCGEEGEPCFHVIRITEDPASTERHERTEEQRKRFDYSKHGVKPPSLPIVTRRE